MFIFCFYYVPVLFLSCLHYVWIYWINFFLTFSVPCMIAFATVIVIVIAIIIIVFINDDSITAVVFPSFPASIFTVIYYFHRFHHHFSPFSVYWRLPTTRIFFLRKRSGIRFKIPVFLLPLCSASQVRGAVWGVQCVCVRVCVYLSVGRCIWGVCVCICVCVILSLRRLTTACLTNLNINNTLHSIS